jgi:hypothetical protein
MKKNCFVWIQVFNGNLAEQAKTSVWASNLLYVQHIRGFLNDCKIIHRFSCFENNNSNRWKNATGGFVQKSVFRHHSLFE